MAEEWPDTHAERRRHGEMTGPVVGICIVAASGGLLFGYDVGVSGGVTTMPQFLAKFFPKVLENMADAKQNDYCMFNNQGVTTFTSSLYISGLVASLVAGRTTVTMGRKATMLMGGLMFLIGTVINALAVNFSMLILGRLLLGCGIGFANQAAPMYVTEMAPAKWRGAFNTAFEFFVQIGVVAANCINYWISHQGEQGWRVAIGCGIVPALVMTLGVLFIPDTPSSLVERGRLPQARASLAQVRGVDSDIEIELSDIISSKEAARSLVKEPYKMILHQKYRPHLILSAAVPFFQQLTGVVVVAFYAPVLFRSLGLTGDWALLGAIVLAVVNLLAVTVSAFIVDVCGRRVLFLQAGIQMLICEVVTACTLAYNVGSTGDQPFTRNTAVIVMVMLCLHAASFGWSWGPLNWLVPSEILPLEVRPAGQSIGVALNFAVTFILAQTFLAMLCRFKYGAFLFFGGWIIVMTTFIMLFLPETKGVQLESMDTVLKKHWYWSRYADKEPRVGKPG